MHPGFVMKDFTESHRKPTLIGMNSTSFRVISNAFAVSSHLQLSTFRFEEM